MSSNPSDPAPRATAPATAAGVALVAMTASALLGGCMANPRPKPLVVATAIRTSSSAAPAPLPTATPTRLLPEPSVESSTEPTTGPTTEPTRKPARHVTASEISASLKSAGIPGLGVVTQPSPRSRMGTNTILYTRPSSYSGSLVLHGTKVELAATPVTYTWRFGDGAARTTTTPGAPYPRHTVTHVYRSPGVFHPSVTTSYQVRYRLPGGRWTTLRGTYAVAGPTTTLTVVRES